MNLKFYYTVCTFGIPASEQPATRVRAHAEQESVVDKVVECDGVSARGRRGATEMQIPCIIRHKSISHPQKIFFTLDAKFTTRLILNSSSNEWVNTSSQIDLSLSLKLRFLEM